MKNKFPTISPLTFILIGFGIAILSLITKGTIEPFSLLAFILMAILEIFFRKQKKISSNLLSFFISIFLVVGIKCYVVDFKRMATDAFVPEIQKNAKIFYLPVFYRLNLGDMVLYTIENDPKVYVGKLKNINGQNLELFRIGTKEIVEVARDNIHGEIIFVLQPT